MRKMYHHLTEQERIFLRIMLNKGFTKTKIAKLLNVARSTIYREIKRNQCVHWANGNVFYNSRLAQDKYLHRRKRGLKLEKNKGLRDYIHNKLEKGWSPWQIEGRLKYENAGADCLISHETIYRYIYSNYNRRAKFYKCLRRKHRYRIKLGQRQTRIPQTMLISERPAAINQRKEFGHWEGDLMIFKRGIKSNFITLVERKTRFVVAIKNINREASGTALALISTMKDFKVMVKSITFDQGGEFMAFGWIEKCLEASIYFCHPASPHAKGSIENRNGLIRLAFPRTYDIETISQPKVNHIIDEINNRPMKCLGFLTPVEAFTQQCVEGF